MRRMVWIAVGAVGGIAVYRRIERAAADVRDRGVIATAQDAGAAAIGAVGAAKDAAAALVAAARRDDEPIVPGDAAAAVLRQSDHRQPDHRQPGQGE